METVTARHLGPNDRISAEGVNVLTVVDVFTDVPSGDYIEVDVEAQKGADIWDMSILAAATGAKQAQWLSSTPRSLYRLFFEPYTRVDLVTG